MKRQYPGITNIRMWKVWFWRFQFLKILNWHFEVCIFAVVLVGIRILNILLFSNTSCKLRSWGLANPKLKNFRWELSAENFLGESQPSVIWPKINPILWPKTGQPKMSLSRKKHKRKSVEKRKSAEKLKISQFLESLLWDEPFCVKGEKLLLNRAGHFRYFWIFSIIKNYFLHVLSS